jgi:hypothetical protein
VRARECAVRCPLFFSSNVFFENAQMRSAVPEKS